MAAGTPTPAFAQLVKAMQELQKTVHEHGEDIQMILALLRSCDVLKPAPLAAPGPRTHDGRLELSEKLQRAIQTNLQLRALYGDGAECVFADTPLTAAATGTVNLRGTPSPVVYLAGPGEDHERRRSLTIPLLIELDVAFYTGQTGYSRDRPVIANWQALQECALALFDMTDDEASDYYTAGCELMALVAMNGFVNVFLLNLPADEQHLLRIDHTARRPNYYGVHGSYSDRDRRHEYYTLLQIVMTAVNESIPKPDPSMPPSRQVTGTVDGVFRNVLANERQLLSTHAKWNTAMTTDRLLRQYQEMVKFGVKTDVGALLQVLFGLCIINSVQERFRAETFPVSFPWRSILGQCRDILAIGTELRVALLDAEDKHAATTPEMVHQRAILDIIAHIRLLFKPDEKK